MPIAVAGGGYLLAAAAVGAGAAMYSANKQSKSASRANDIQQSANNFTEQQALDTKENLRPYMDAAQPAVQALQQGTSQGGEFNRPITVNDINGNIAPDYEWVKNQGELGVNRQNAAQGLYGSGAASKAMAQYDTGLASGYANTAFHNYQDSLASRFQRLQQVAGMGQNAAAGQGGLTNQAASTISNSSGQMGQNIIGAGNANAAGVVGAANSISGSLNNMGTLSLLKQYGVSPTDSNGGISSGSMNQSAGGNLGVTYGIGGQQTGTA